MKHIIEFDISGADQLEELDRLELMMKAQKMQSVIWDTYRYFRQELKYNDDLTEVEIETLESSKAAFMEFMELNDLLSILD
jgi:hypothetical protein